MTAFTSSGSGNWNNSATWGGAGFPTTTGDTASIGAGHNITVPSGYTATCGAITCAAGTNNTTLRTQITIAGELDLGGTLSFAGNNALTLNAGGVIDLKGNNITNSSTDCLFTCSGTVGSRCTVKCSGGTRGSITFNTNTSVLYCTYTDFSGLADGSVLGRSHGSTSGPFVNFCTFTNMDDFYLEGTNSTANWGCDVRWNDFRSPHSAGKGPRFITSNQALSSNARFFSHNTFDGGSGLGIITMTNLAPVTEFAGNVFSRYSLLITGNSLTTLSGNMWYNASNDDQAFGSSFHFSNNGDYFYYDGGNHVFGAAGGIPNGSFTAQNSIHEVPFKGPLTTVGNGTTNLGMNWYLPGNTGTHTIQNCLFIGAGTPLSYTTSSAVTVTYSNNTSYMDNGVCQTSGAFNFYAYSFGIETEQTANLTTPINYYNNLNVDKNTNDNNVLSQASDTECAVTLVNAVGSQITTADYNGHAGYDHTGAYVTTTIGYYQSSSNTTIPGVGTHDVHADPQFVDRTRGLAAWDKSLGGAGTAANAITQMLKKNGTGGTFNTAYTQAALYSYVKAGFSPLNTAYKGTGSGSVDIGAFPVTTGSWPAINLSTGNAPSSGGSSAAGSTTWFLFGAMVPRSGQLVMLEVQAGASATLTIKRFRRSGLTLTWLDENNVSVVSGTNTIDLTSLGWNWTAGDFPALYSATANAVQYKTAGVTISKTEYYSTGSNITTSFNVSAAGLPNEGIAFQARFTFAVATETAANAVGSLFYEGSQSPAAGSTPTLATSTTYYDDVPLVVPVRIEQIKTYATAQNYGFVLILSPTADGYSCRPFRIDFPSGAATLVAGTDFPIDVLVPVGGLIGIWSCGNLSEDASNVRFYRTLDATVAGGLWPTTDLTAFVAGADASGGVAQIQFGLRRTQVDALSATKIDWTFNNLHPRFDVTNWSLNGDGTVSNSATGISNSVVFREGNRCDGTASVYFQFTTSSDEISVFRLPNESGENLGSMWTVNLSTGLIALHAAISGNQSTTPSVTHSKTSTLTFATAKPYRIDLVKTRRLQSLTITDINAAQSDSLSYNTVGGTPPNGTVDEVSGQCIGKPGFCATAGTLKVSRLVFTAGQAQGGMMFGDSITEGTGATTNSNSWSATFQASLSSLVSAHAGQGASNLLSYIEYEMRQFMPPWACIHIGTNDTSAANAEAGITEIVKRIESVGAEAVICAIPPQPGVKDWIASTLNPWIEALRPGQIVRMDKAITVSGDGLTLDTSKMLSDLLHPNDTGHAAYVAQAKSDVPSIFSLSVPVTLGSYVLDNGLNGLDAHADTVYICNAQPTTYTQASSTFAIGSNSPGAGNVFNSASGNTMQSIALAAVPSITANGTATYFAVTGGTDLLLVAALPSTVVTSGQTFSLGQYTLTMPTS